MVSMPLVRLKSVTAKIARNPHLWVLAVVSTGLLLIYQAWPWSHAQLAQGVWRHFPWLSHLESLVLGFELKYDLFGSLFLVPIIYGSLTLSWPGGLFAWGLSLIWVVPTTLAWPSSERVFNIVMLLLPVLMVAIFQGERRWRESQRRHYAEGEQARRAYIAKLVEAQEAERRRIAQELHDETLQDLMVIANKCDALALSGVDKGQIKANLWMKKELLRTIENVRRLSMNLRPSILDNFGLVSGIRWLVNNSNSQGSCRLRVSVEGEERAMSSLSEVTAFRVIQEAVNNIQRHASATRGTVNLKFEGDSLLLEARDDGVGFQPPEKPLAYVGESKLGILGMEQRILSIGGQFRVDSHPGRGTKIQASIPYEASAQVVEGENT
jgi:two-component system sensor histidine kinase DegS